MRIGSARAAYRPARGRALVGACGEARCVSWSPHAPPIRTAPPADDRPPAGGRPRGDIARSATVVRGIKHPKHIHPRAVSSRGFQNQGSVGRGTAAIRLYFLRSPSDAPPRRLNRCSHPSPKGGRDRTFHPSTGQRTPHSRTAPLLGAACESRVFEAMRGASRLLSQRTPHAIGPPSPPVRYTRCSPAVRPSTHVADGPARLPVG